MRFTSANSDDQPVPITLVPAPETVRLSDLLLGGEGLGMGWEEEEEEEEEEEKEEDKRKEQEVVVGAYQSQSETEGLHSILLTSDTLKLLLIAATNFSDFSEKPHNR